MADRSRQRICTAWTVEAGMPRHPPTCPAKTLRPQVQAQGHHGTRGRVCAGEESEVDQDTGAQQARLNADSDGDHGDAQVVGADLAHLR
jgi:hypothetical protein